MWTLVPMNTSYTAHGYLMANDKSKLTALLRALVQVSLDDLLAPTCNYVQVRQGLPHIMPCMSLVYNYMYMYINCKFLYL